MRFIYLILILLFVRCKTIKYVDREVIKIDSSVIEENKTLKIKLTETISQFEREKNSWLNTGVLFDTIYRDTGKVVNRIVFDNGKIKSIEGRLLAVNHKFIEKSSELMAAQTTIDSMGVELEKKDSRLLKKQETVIKEVKRTVKPYWLFILLLIIGLFLEYRFKIIKTILSFKKYFL